MPNKWEVPSRILPYCLGYYHIQSICQQEENHSFYSWLLLWVNKSLCISSVPQKLLRYFYCHYFQLEVSNITLPLGRTAEIKICQEFYHLVYSRPMWILMGLDIYLIFLPNLHFHPLFSIAAPGLRVITCALWYSWSDGLHSALEFPLSIGYLGKIRMHIWDNKESPIMIRNSFQLIRKESNLTNIFSLKSH